MTVEYRSALAALTAAALLLALATGAGAGLQTAAALALLGYAGAVWALTSLLQIRCWAVLRATSRGLVVAAVLAALVLVGIGKALAEVAS
ncbi:hypothetical protein [Streptomyces sp. WMMB303]|uniref:hypothetical protein n=1 Tax=Streptomyces sp. WMMB303 TaxID=3034154 RepID=UPI0023ED3650|nr:hypothetical protein [Streptomyces sp. WMMB303]MDF4254689.1 hypothetical protein [Streptomyces sp. WMMB303]